MSELLDLLLAGMGQPQADQPNSLAEGLPVIRKLSYRCSIDVPYKGNASKSLNTDEVSRNACFSGPLAQDVRVQIKPGARAYDGISSLFRSLLSYPNKHTRSSPTPARGVPEFKTRPREVLNLAKSDPDPLVANLVRTGTIKCKALTGSRTDPRINLGREDTQG
eukprot:1146328-Pelagomonas_calceolata.AAC.2